ncbi:MAG TPA: flavodoxin family protein [Spirochaetes bacterium]|nr:flavodoxin family protein [Spirochaetota bacterium]
MNGQDLNKSILAVGGSPRKRGNTDLLIELIAAGAAKYGIATEAVHLRDVEFSSCVGCERCRLNGVCARFDDDMTALYQKIIASRGLVLVSPVYNYNMTAWMKAFIDRLYCFYDFDEPRPGGWSSRLANQGRKAIIAAVGEQPGPEDAALTLAAMGRPLEALGYDIIAELPVTGVFSKGKVMEAPGIVAGAESLGRKLAEAIKGD